MTGLGDRLKEARIEKGFTLEDLQSITKIQKRYLAGIENEEYGMMPGSFYVRAFIKQYAEAVGLDADEMLSLYRDSPEAIKPEEEELQLTSPTLRRRSGARGNSQLNEVMPKVIVALFILMLVGVAWFLIQNSASKKQGLDVETEEPITIVDQVKQPDEKADEKIDSAKEEENGDEQNTEEDTVDQTVEQTLTNLSVDGETSTYSLVGADEFLLEIRTAGDSWIGVQDSSSVERMPQPRGADVFVAGESVELDVSDTDSARIRVGATVHTEIYVNGELLTYATSPSDRTTQNIIIEYKKD